MLGTVTTKTLYDQRRGLLSWAIGLLSLVGLYAALWPSIGSDPSYKDVLDKMPEALRSLFSASGADMTTGSGYLQVELLSFMAPMLMLLYAITAGAAGIAGEEDRHTADLLFTNPIGRDRLLLEKFGAMAAGCAGLGAVTLTGLLAFGSMAGMDLPAWNVTAVVVHLTLLAVLFGSIALATGALTGHAGLARAVPAIAAVLTYVLNGLAQVVSWLEPAQVYSPFYQYVGHDPMRNGLSEVAVVVTVVEIAVVVAVALWGFRRRDVLS